MGKEMPTWVSLSRRDATLELQHGLEPPRLFESPKRFLKHQKKCNSPSSAAVRNVGVQHAGLYSLIALWSIDIGV